MKAANSKSVYKKLRKLYGSSFHNIFDYPSLEDSEQEKYTQDSEEIQFYSESRLVLSDKSQSEKSINESVAFADSSPVEKTTDFTLQDSVTFFAEGHLEDEDCPSSSKKIQKKIEHLAEKITRSIIYSKGLDKD